MYFFSDCQLLIPYRGYPVLRLVRYLHQTRCLALHAPSIASLHNRIPPDALSLSGCIFEWSQEDLALLKTAKQQEIEGSGAGQLSPLQWISKRELVLHCRKRTRGDQKTESLLHSSWSISVEMPGLIRWGSH